MDSSFFYTCSLLAGVSPFLAILGILCWHSVYSAFLRGSQPRGKRRLALWSSSFVLGTALQFLQVIYQPSATHALEVKHDDQADEDDSGDPETLTKQLNRQLRKIRRGEPIDSIVLRLADNGTTEP